MTYRVEAVYKDGNPVNFFVEKEGDYMVIYVGEEDLFLDPGFYTYTIAYESAGQVGYFDSYDELSWNINGLSPHSLDTVSATVRIPAEAEILSYHCYSGAIGAKESDCTAEQVEDHLLYVEGLDLPAEEMITVSVGFTAGVVSKPVLPPPGPQPTTFFDKRGLPVVGVLLLLLLLPYYYFTWRRYGVDPPKPVVIPQFNPPAGFSPAGVGMIHKERFESDFITASLVNLAVKGYIRIREREDRGGIFGLRRDRRYTMVKLKEGDTSLPHEEQVIMRDLFRSDDEVTLTGKYDEDVGKMYNSFSRSIESQYDPVLKEGLNLKFHIFPALLFVGYIFLLLYWSVFEPREQLLVFIGIASISFLGLLVLSLLLRKIFNKSKIKWFGLVLGGALICGMASLLFLYPRGDLSVNAISFIVITPLLIISYLAYAYLIKKPGVRKLHFQSLVEGLKLYIDTAEEKRMQYFNPPQMTPEVFETLLPYAIALDMEKIWGDKFQKEFLASISMSEPYQPSWFSGTVLRPSDFGHTLSSTLSNTVAHSATDPTVESSGGNWSSGSFGGGSVGMGGGGGSVGGW